MLEAKRSAPINPLLAEPAQRSTISAAADAMFVTPLWVARTLPGLVGGFFGRRRRSGAKCRRQRENL